MIYLALIAVATLLVLFVRQRYNYWKVRGVPYLDPVFPAGNVWGLGTRLHPSEVLQKCYDKLKGKGPFGGVFFFLGPTVLATDLDFIKTILVKDFQYFHDRSFYYNEKDDPLTGHLFTIEGQRWKNLRAKLTPTFTSGKMKLMFPIVSDVAAELKKCLVTEKDDGGEVELKDVLARYTTDVIGKCAFGLDCNSLENPNAEFREMGRKIFTTTPLSIIKLFFVQQIKPLAQKLGVTVLNQEVTKYFLKAVKDTVEYRESNNVERNDFMNLLIKLKNAEPVEEGSSRPMEKLSLNEISAQAFVFFFAGFETSSTLMSFCLYELAMNQELQDRARKNVRDVLNQHGSLTYEAIHGMKYLENCIFETLRIYPPASILFRIATQDYRVPNTDFTIEKGTATNIPVLAIHRDPELYPDPMKFDPERFNPDQVAKRHPFAFLPFGEGPRVCIGMRFALMQTRVGLATLLQNFRFRISSRTPIPPKIVPSSGLFVPQDNFWLSIERIE
uniref:Probable cytochrome P450 6a14 n=1 Tax=Culex pipiens TaxID=7175 RepID=A0A8D8IIE1_CULPI